MIRRIQRRTRQAFALVLLVPVVLACVMIWFAGRYQDRLAWVEHTRIVIHTIDDFLLSATMAETTKRGYLLTHDRRYLDHFASAKREASSEIRELRELAADNARQQRRIADLQQEWTQRLTEMDTLVGEARRSGRVPADVVALMARGQILEDRIRHICSDMTSEENALLSARITAQRNSAAGLSALFVAAILITLVLLYWAYALIRQYSLARDLADMEIRELNAELERRVQERTSDLQTANEHLRRSNEDLTRFAYVASHDLQEPLRTVGSYAGLLGRRYEGKLDEQADKYIRFIVDGAKRMQTLVQDLLAYSRAGTEALKIEPVAMDEVLADVKRDLRVAIEEKHAAIVSSTLPVISADGGKLGIVLQNLIGNALKFSKPGLAPKVEVHAHQENGDWIFSVTDNGIGFEPEYTDRIFIMFQRLHQVGAYPGTGIGLAISKRIVEAHGGQIWATSQPGVGSIFNFSIPGADVSRPGGSGKAAGEPTPSTERGTLDASEGLIGRR
ncbi:MAG: CHASE3 domain-containing protein [Acidobacteriaceae bacterium]|nr:CHASE3 domain-containing protein [Acidobacteriaceae bacterium]